MKNKQECVGTRRTWIVVSLAPSTFQSCKPIPDSSISLSRGNHQTPSLSLRRTKVKGEKRRQKGEQETETSRGKGGSRINLDIRDQPRAEEQGIGKKGECAVYRRAAGRGYCAHGASAEAPRLHHRLPLEIKQIRNSGGPGSKGARAGGAAGGGSPDPSPCVQRTRGSKDHRERGVRSLPTPRGVNTRTAHHSLIARTHQWRVRAPQWGL